MGKGKRIRSERGGLTKAEIKINQWNEKCLGSKYHGTLDPGTTSKVVDLFQENSGHGRFFIRTANLKEKSLDFKFVPRKYAELFINVLKHDEDKSAKVLRGETKEIAVLDDASYIDNEVKENDGN